MNAAARDVDVLIVGGGPGGLFSAIELGRRGIRALLVEPRVTLDPLRPRAKTTSVRTMEHLRRLGLADRLRAQAPIPVAYSQDVIFCTALFGREITRFPHAFALTTERCDDWAETSQQVPQPVLEQLLRSHLSTLPSVTTVFGSRVTALEEDHECVRAVMLGADGRTWTATARLAIGADGASGISRQAIGAKYEGVSGALPNVNVTFRSTALTERVPACGRAVHYWIVGQSHGGLMGPLDLTGTWWAIVQGVADPREFDAVAVLREFAGASIDVEVLATDPWSARTLIVDRYASRRVFLVGDAAHLNPPWGGHGFNTCCGDAVNLSWKIAAVLRGWGGAALLSSYEPERRPIALRTLEAAGAQEAFLAPSFAAPGLGDDDERGRELRRLAAERIQAAKYTEFNSLGLVLGYDYPDSPIVWGEPDVAPLGGVDTFTPSAHAGARLPHAWLDDGRSLYDVLGPEFSILTFGTSTGAFERAASARGVPLTVVDLRASRHLYDRYGADLILVRSDGHVAWRGGGDENADVVLARAVGA